MRLKKFAMPAIVLALSAFPFFNARSQFNAKAQKLPSGASINAAGACTISVRFGDLASVSYSNDTLIVDFRGGYAYADTRLAGRLQCRCPKIGVYSLVAENYQFVFVAVVDVSKGERNVHTLSYSVNLLDPQEVGLRGVSLGSRPDLPEGVAPQSFIWSPN